jgi:hypothetical protein
MKSFAMAPGVPVEVMAEAMGLTEPARESEPKPAPAAETPAPKRRPVAKPES